MQKTKSETGRDSLRQKTDLIFEFDPSRDRTQSMARCCAARAELSPTQPFLEAATRKFLLD
jgi:hypothetical protein